MAARTITDTATGEDVNYLRSTRPPQGNIMGPYGRSFNIKPIQFSYSEADISPSYFDRSQEGEDIARSPMEIFQNRIDNQPEVLKFTNAVIGGAISGIGTLVEDVGYLFDLDTYRGIYSDIDFEANKNLISQLGSTIKEKTNEFMPIYEEPTKEGDYINQVFRWSTMKGIVDSVVGFGLLGGGVGAGLKTGVSQGLKGLSKVGRFGKFVSQSNKFSRLTSFSDKMAKTFSKLERTEAFAKSLNKANPQIAQILGPSTAAIFTKSAEARMEGLEAYENSLYKMQPLIDANVVTKQQAKDAANIAGNKAFDMTMLTVAGDALMLKGLFKGRTTRAKILSKPNRWKVEGKNLLGLPKEMAEESWQEAAKQEGNYLAFSYLKEKLAKDGSLSKLNKVLNPDDYPQDYSQRLISFLSSTESMVAGTIGALAGPLQQKFVNGISGVNEFKQLQEDYNNQKTQFENNKQLFNATAKFAGQVKQTVESEEFKNMSTIFGESDLQDLAEETVFNGVALTNIIKGTQEDLRNTIKQNKISDTIDYESKLTELEKDYVKTQKYFNSEEVFTAMQSLKLGKKLLTSYKTKSQDETLTKKEREGFALEVPKQVLFIDKLQANLNAITSKSYQANLFNQEQTTQKLVKASERLASTTSITALQRIAKQYPTLKELANEKILQLRSSNTNNKVKNLKTAEVQKTTEEQDIEIEIPKNIPVSKLNKKDLKQERITDNEGNNYTSKGNIVYTDSQLETMFTPQMSKVFNSLEDGLQPSNQDVQTVIDLYKENIDEVTDVGVFTESVLLPKITELAQKAKNRTNSTEDVPVIEIPKDKIIADTPNNTGISEKSKEAINSLFNTLGSFEMLEMADEQDINSKAKTQAELDAKADEELKAFRLAIYSLEDDGIWNRKEDPTVSFKKIIQAFIDGMNNDVELIRSNYTLLKGLFLQVSRKDIKADSFDDLLGLSTADPTIDPDMPTRENNERIINSKLLYVSTANNSEELTSIYTDESVENVDKKNTVPAVSFAHLSKQWLWKILGKTSRGDKLVGREDVGNKINANPLLNPEKYNEGDTIELAVDSEYAGEIWLSNGSKVDWKEFKTYSDSHTKEEFLKKYKLQIDETIEDYTPIFIKGEDGIVAYVHQVSWIHKLNVVSEIQEESKKVLKAFRKELITADKTNPGQTFETVVDKKVLEINKQGQYSGFVLDRSFEWSNTNEKLPATNLELGIKKLGDLTTSKDDIILNNGFLPDFGGGTVYIFVPLGKKKGKMVYHADPLTSNKISKEQARSLRQAIEIFITQNSTLNIELYNHYKNIDGTDLLTAKGLNKVLNKVLFLYRSDSKDGVQRSTLEDMLNQRIAEKNTGLGFIEFQKNTLKFGRSSIQSATKGQPIDSSFFDTLENFILPNMYFNANKKLINSKEDFNFVEVDSESKINPFKGDYNSYVKQNTKTTLRSTKLLDDSYTYTYQNIVTFDMRETKQEEEKVIVPTTEDLSSDWRLNPDVKTITEAYKSTIDVVFKPVIDGIMGLDKFIKLQKNIIKAEKFSDEGFTGKEFNDNYENC